jgi:uncharacterized protein (DUF427 family)
MVTFTWWDDDVTWLEEDEEVFAHARDPRKRVDVVASTRHVQVRAEGEQLADSRPRLKYARYVSAVALRVRA